VFHRLPQEEMTPVLSNLIRVFPPVCLIPTIGLRIEFIKQNRGLFLRYGTCAQVVKLALG
jgi:hypothetical protein